MILYVVGSIVLLLMVVVFGRAWLKKQSWAQGFFAAIEPFEIVLFRKSETILFGRLLWVGSALVTLYDTLAVFAGVNWTPVTTRALAHVPEDLRGLILTAIPIAIGLVINWLRKRTTKPVEIVEVANKDITPAVAQALVAAEVTKQDAVAAVTDAKAGG